MQSKYSKILLVGLSYISLLQATECNPYQLSLRFLSGNVHKTEHYIDLTEAERDMIVANGLNNELALRLETILNESSLEVDFYSLRGSKAADTVQIEDGKLIVRCVLQRPKFHLNFNRLFDTNICRLALRSPWITKSVEMIFEIDRVAHEIPDEMIFDSMEEIERYLPTNHKYEPTIDRQSIPRCITTDPTKIEYVFRQAYFIDSLSNKMGYSITDIVRLFDFLGIESCLAYPMCLMHHGDNKYSIGERIQDSEIDLYQVFFIDEKHEERSWYNPQYSYPTTNHGSQSHSLFSVATSGSLQRFPTCPDKGLILQYIKVAGKKYEFIGKLDIGYEPVFEYVIQTFLKHIRDRLPIEPTSMPDNRYRETWNSISLEDACKSIEQDISFINSLALQANREPSDMIRLLVALNRPCLNKCSIVEEPEGKYIIKMMQDQTLIHEIFLRDNSSASSWYQSLYRFFLGDWHNQIYLETVYIDEVQFLEKLLKHLPDEVILDKINLGAETYSVNVLVPDRKEMAVILSLINSIIPKYTQNKLNMFRLTQLEARWKSIRLADAIAPMTKLFSSLANEQNKNT